jgi:hypothetical protein
LDQQNKEFVTAIAGAVATVLAAVIPPLWKAIQKRRVTHLSERRGKLLGRWEGHGGEYYVEDPRQKPSTFSVIMTFTSAEYNVNANAILRAPGAPDDEVRLKGVFYDDDYLQLSYRNSSKKQMGVVVLGLNGQSDGLEGYYAGYSPSRATIVAGKLSLRKTP